MLFIHTVQKAVPPLISRWMLLLFDTHLGQVQIYFSELFIRKQCTKNPIDKYTKNYIFVDCDNMLLVSYNDDDNGDDYDYYNDQNTTIKDRPFGTLNSFDKQLISVCELQENKKKFLNYTST